MLFSTPDAPSVMTAASIALRLIAVERGDESFKLKLK
jgi:hypothetical protein